MADILEDGENIEVNYSAAIDPTTATAPSKDSFSNRTKRILPFTFGQNNKAVTPDAASTTNSSSADNPAVPTPVTPEPKEEEPEREAMFFSKRRGERLQSHLFEEDEPELLQSDAESDEQSLVEAETAEGILGSALRLAEEGTGESFLSVARSPRNDAIELGRRVSSLSDIRGVVGMGRTPSLLSDDGSVHTMGSQATETTFIKVAKVDPATITPEMWGEIVGASILDNNEMEDVPLDDVLDAVPPTAKSPPRQRRQAKSSNDVPRVIDGPANERKWDKLRDTLDAQERGATVGYELELESKQKKKSGTSPQRMKRLGKGLRKSLDCFKPKTATKGDTAQPDDASLSKAALPAMQKAPGSFPKQKMVDGKPFDVNIEVQDLSKKINDQDLNSTLDPTVGSIDEDDLQDPEEAESMEVVYLVSETDEQIGDTLPPFPTKLVGKII